MYYLQYSPHPAEFYTYQADNGPAGLGAGPSATNPGLWNLTWLTCTQCDLFEERARQEEKGELKPISLPIWTPEFQRPFVETAAFRLNGTPIALLAALLHAGGLSTYMLSHPDLASIPLYKTFGAAWCRTIEARAAIACNTLQESKGDLFHLIPMGPPDFTLADPTRSKILSMGDWAAKLNGEVKH